MNLSPPWAFTFARIKRGELNIPAPAGDADRARRAKSVQAHRATDGERHCTMSGSKLALRAAEGSGAVHSVMCNQRNVQHSVWILGWGRQLRELVRVTHLFACLLLGNVGLESVQTTLDYAGDEHTSTHGIILPLAGHVSP